jgi:hypothetical protein
MHAVTGTAAARLVIAEVWDSCAAFTCHAAERSGRRRAGSGAFRPTR